MEQTKTKVHQNINKALTNCCQFIDCQKNNCRSKRKMANSFTIIKQNRKRKRKLKWLLLSQMSHEERQLQCRVRPVKFEHATFISNNRLITLPTITQLISLMIISFIVISSTISGFIGGHSALESRNASIDFFNPDTVEQLTRPLVDPNKSKASLTALPSSRFKRAAPLDFSSKATSGAPLSPSGGDSTTRIVAISGQWIELQCPLSSELLAIANSGAQNPDHSIVWLKNSTRLNQLSPRLKLNALNNSLIIISAQPTLDDGLYECALIQLLKEDHFIKSHRFDLKLIVPPRLAPFESPHQAQVGMKLVLTCSALEGQQPISFIWLKDNQIIQGQQTSEIQAAHQSHLLSNHLHHHQANSLDQLHQQQLADKFALSSGSSGSLYSLFGDAKSGRNQEYVVLSNTQQQQHPTGSEDNQQQLLSILSDSQVKIRQSDDYSILSIDRLELKHSGRYTCSAQNEAARTSYSSQLQINAPPMLTLEPKDGDLVSGQSSVIDCSASGQPKPTIAWLRARESSNKAWDYIPVYDNLKFTTLSNGSLMITNVTLREQGYYLCSAKNGFGPEMTKLIKIVVHEPAKFASKFKTVEVRIEDRANMVCVANGELPLTIEWLDKEGNTIQKNDKKFIIENDPSDIQTMIAQDLLTPNSTVSRLMLAKSTRADSGHYTCRASNKYGSDKMIKNLLVQDVPDKIVDLKVTNTTSSTISLRWQLAFNGNSPITSYLVQYQSDDPLDDLLMISQQQLQHKQDQQSSAQSQLPSVPESAQEQFNVKSSSLLRKLDSTNDNEMMSLINELNEIDDEASIDRTLVELTIESQQLSASSNVNNNFLVIKDLIPFCLYRLRIAPINKIGLGEFSDWLRVKTEEAPPSGSALKILASATGPNSIKIQWNPPDRRSWNGQLLGFNIGYRPLDSNFEHNKTIEWSPPTLKSIMMVDGENGKKLSLSNKKTSAAKSSNDQPKNQPAATNSSTSLENKDSKHLLRQHLKQLMALQQQELVAHLTNLQRSTTYLIYLQAINNRGLGPQSHAISIKTLDDVPPSAPIVKIQSTTMNSITISWSLPTNFVSLANQYSLFYRKLPNKLTNISDPISMGLFGDHTQQVSSDSQQPQLLTPEPGPFIERTINSQLLMVPNQQHFTAANLFADPREGSPADHSIQDQMQKLASGNYMNHYQQFQHTLDGLDCGQVYELYMTTRNSVGKSEPSPIVTTRTQGEPPQAPANKNNLFSKIGANDVALNLASWSTGGCPLTHITVRYKQSPTPITSASSNAASSQASLASSSNQTHGASSMAVTWPITTTVPASIVNNVNGQLQSQQQSLTRSLGNNGLNLKINNELANSQPIYLLKNLLPSTCYDLELIAHNGAGQTAAQYEFVTSNLNGTRGGYSRKESIYRLDQRGIVIMNDELIDQQHASPNNLSGANASSNQNWQILPFILMIVCLLCLIVSSTFCYYKLTDLWRGEHNNDKDTHLGRRRRRSSLDTSASGVLGARAHLCTQQGQPSSHLRNINQSPNSIGKSSMWQMSVNANNHHHHNQSIEHQEQQQLEQSPTTTVHYCMREPIDVNNNMLKNQPSFSQSVSMKDFNLITSPPSLPLGAAATLNYKNYRNSMIRPANDLCVKAGTMRPGRLMSQPTNEYHIGDTAKETQLSSLQHQTTYDYSYEGEQQQQNEQETSWTNCSSLQSQLAANHGPNKALAHRNGTTYAIPTYGTALNNQADQQQIAYGNYGEPGANSIDACIQQLISQQYHEQQQYAMIVGQQQRQPNDGRCVYDQQQQQQQMSSAYTNNKQQQQQAQQLNQKLATVGGQSQSIIDSSSGSSSGIDVGTHVDCSASTITTTTNSNNLNGDSSSNNNNGYQLTYPSNTNCNEAPIAADGYEPQNHDLPMQQQQQFFTSLMVQSSSSVATNPQPSRDSLEL